MFALEDRPFVRFSPFFALFPDSLSLSSARSRPAASSLTAGAGLTRSPRIVHGIQYAPATLPGDRLRRDKKVSPSKARTMNTQTHYTSKPFRMRTYAKMGEGGTPYRDFCHQNPTGT
jgi:hypothetical protein